MAGFVVSFVLVGLVSDVPERTAAPLYLTGATSIVLGLFAFTLPHTPPPAAGESVSLRSIIGLDALEQLGSRSFRVFIGQDDTLVPGADPIDWRLSYPAIPVPRVSVYL